MRLDVAGAALVIAPATAAESALQPGRTPATGGLQADDAADSRSITSSAAASAVAHAASVRILIWLFCFGVTSHTSI